MQNNDRAYKDAFNVVAYLNALNRAGLTDGVIGAITATGTVAKLNTAIAAIVMPERQKYLQREAPTAILRAQRDGTLTDADVETARAAGTFASLIVAIQVHPQAATVDTKAQVHVPYAL